MTIKLLRSNLLFLLLMFSAIMSYAQQDSAYIRDNYIKYEYKIAMRDGAKLFTEVYVPKDNSKKYPIMLHRTPYSVGPYGKEKYKTSLGPSSEFVKEGFIFAYQDVRGKFMSEGSYEDIRPFNPAKKGTEIDEASDAYDTVNWLVKNVPNTN